MKSIQESYHQFKCLCWPNSSSSSTSSSLSSLSPFGRRSTMNVVFLDIDGVLLPFEKDVLPPMVFPEPQLRALSQILEATDAVLVLSSTWRVAERFRAQILQSFLEYGRVHGGPLASVTCFYDVTDPLYHANRQWEIHRWLQHYQRRNPTTPRISAWVALDDVDLLEGEKNQLYKCHFEGHVVRTNSHTGLTCDDAALAIELMQRQQLEKRGRRQQQQQNQQQPRPKRSPLLMRRTSSTESSPLA